MRPGFLSLVLLVALASAWSVPAQGCALAVSMNLEEMVSRADRIFVGECVSAEARWAPIAGANLPITEVTFAVEEAIRGADGETVTFRQYGQPPSQSSISRGIDHMPRFEPGRRHLILLGAPVRPSGLTTTIGLDQGAFLIEEIDGETVFRNGRGNVGLHEGMSWRMSASESVVDVTRRLAESETK